MDRETTLTEIEPSQLLRVTGGTGVCTVDDPTGEKPENQYPGQPALRVSTGKQCDGPITTKEKQRANNLRGLAAYQVISDPIASLKALNTPPPVRCQPNDFQVTP